MNQTQEPFPKNLRNLLALLLLIGVGFSYSELRAIWSPEQTWDKLLTPLGWFTIGLFILLAVISLVVLLLSLWIPERIQPFAKRISVLRWPLAVILLGCLAWIYLFSPWQATLSAPWTQFILAAALARLLAWLFVPERTQPFGWSELVLAFSLFLYPRIVQEVRISYPSALFTRGSMLAGFAALLFLLFLFERPNLGQKIISLRARLGRVRQPLAILFLLTPLLYRYLLGAGGYILYPNIRFAVWLVALSAAAILLCAESGRLVSLEAVGISVGWLVLVSAVTRSLLAVSSDPFGTYWSEGNRLYDYSLVFGQAVYNHVGRIPNPYDSPGRYGLWGLLFLWRGLPIAAHRFWNVVILTLPSLILAWALTRKLHSVIWRRALFLWITAFFILLAPLQPPFMLVAAIVALFAFQPSPVVRGASLVTASLYAGFSRWTWVFAPGAWGALTDLLLYYPQRKGSWFKRLLPTALMALLGALPGFLLNLGNFFGYTSGSNTTANQPLLWYRLLPNPTLGPGVALLTLMITGPLAALLIYKMVTRQWQLDGFQLLAIWGALIGFLGAGLVISTKIGGGGDLHNLDMFIGTLMLVTVLGLAAQPNVPDVKRWPAWALAMMCLLALQPLYSFTPFYPSANYNAWLDLPTRADTDLALRTINSAVSDYSKRGEVLFMDQRQLLTFGYVPAVPFVAEYEKKYMMDQAMASNASYFLPYYKDLAAKRFTLIVTEPLKVNLKDGSGIFSEENDLWVAWVSAPTLCFYQPIFTDKTVGVMMLVPRENPIGCEKYLNGN